MKVLMSALIALSVSRRGLRFGECYHRQGLARASREAQELFPGLGVPAELTARAGCETRAPCLADREVAPGVASVEPFGGRGWARTASTL